jgi:hypothetical protein
MGDDPERAKPATKFAQRSLCHGTAVHVVCAGGERSEARVCRDGRCRRLEAGAGGDYCATGGGSGAVEASLKQKEGGVRRAGVRELVGCFYVVKGVLESLL